MLMIQLEGVLIFAQAPPTTKTQPDNVSATVSQATLIQPPNIAYLSALATHMVITVPILV